MNLDPKDDSYYAKIRHYTCLLKTFPNNIHLLELRANCRFCHADWRRAANDYERLVKAIPDNSGYWGMLGQTCVHGRLPERAVAACTRAVELDPELEFAYMHRGWAYRQLKQWDASIADYTKARELDLKHRGTMHSTRYRGELYLAMGNYEKAAWDFTMAIAGSQYWSALYALRGIAYMKMKQYEKVIENANAYMDLCGEPWVYLLKQRVKAYKNLGQKEKARDDLALIQRLEEKIAKENEVNQKFQDKQPVHVSEAKEKAKECDDKIQRFTEKITDNPKDTMAYCGRGLVYLEKSDYRIAQRDFTRAIRLNNNCFAAYYHRAECFQMLNQTIKALRDLDRAIYLCPKSLAAYNLRARIFNELGETEKEIADLEKIHELYPDDTSWPVMSLGELYEETGRYEQAVEFHAWYMLHEELRFFGSFNLLKYRSRAGYQRPKLRKLSAALADNPGNAALYFVRGKTYDDDFQFENAIADYTTAISLKPDFLLAYMYRALANSVLSENTGTVEKMIADYTQVLKLDGTLTAIHSELGSLYKKLKQYEPAIACFNKALEIDPCFYEVYRLRSEVLELTGDFQASIDDLTLFLDQQANKDTSVLSRRGDIYFKTGDYIKAVFDYSAAIEQEKNKSWSIGSLKMNLEKRGKCYEALHEIEKAKADFMAAAKIQKKEW